MILLTVTKPKKMTPKVSGDWSQFLSTVKENAEDNQDIELIGDSAVSIRGKDGLYPFAQILVAAHKLNFAYSVGLFEGKEGWNCNADA
jgi:hypothetical protein